MKKEKKYINKNLWQLENIFFDGVKFKQPQKEIKIKIEEDKKDKKLLQYKKFKKKNFIYNKDGINLSVKDGLCNIEVSNSLMPTNSTIEEKALFMGNILLDKLTEKYGYKIGLSVKKINNNKEKND